MPGRPFSYAQRSKASDVRSIRAPCCKQNFTYFLLSLPTETLCFFDGPNAGCRTRGLRGRIISASSPAGAEFLFADNASFLTMRLILAPLNPTVGDLAGNASLICAAADAARAARADVLVCPELTLTGYPPKDLLLQGGFLEACVRTAEEVGRAASGRLTLIFGTPWPVSAHQPSPFAQHNTLLAYRDGCVLAHYHKRLLPTYDVFDEDRYFIAGASPVWIDVPTGAGSGNGPGPIVRIGLSVCEDLWHGRDAGSAQRYLGVSDPVDELCTPRLNERRCSLIINPSASPFVIGKAEVQQEILRHHAVRHKVTVAAVNQLGANDELIFDGSAIVIGPNGEMMAAGSRYGGELLTIDLPQVEGETGLVARTGSVPRPVHVVVPGPGANAAAPIISEKDTSDLFFALALGIKDYCRKTGFTTALLGLSGGIDSAVCAVLAAAAIGAERVTGVSMPGEYSSEGSKTDAHKLAHNLSMPMLTIPIGAPVNGFLEALTPAMAGTTPDVTEENLQSRCRGTLLMALSNKFNHLLLTTGNKSELAVGYCTLYGDMNGGLAVLSDVTKRQVYALANWMNANFGAIGISGLNVPPIPVASITKPPSAELRPNQTDQDSLPPYEVLDEILRRYVELRQDRTTIVGETGFDGATVKRILRLIDLSEYKRKQTAIGLKVTSVAFGSGRRMPIAQGWKGA